MSLLFFILILVALILVHEFGHFIVAKAFRIRVDEFGIFFPPRIAAVKYGETEYSINWLPFGGFVRIFGENAGEGVGNPRSLASKPRLVQASVIIAGIVFNVLCAWLLFSAGYMIGLPTSVSHVGVGQVRDATPMIVDVRVGSPADLAGLKAEDVVLSIQTGTTALPRGSNSKEIRDFIAAHQDESVILTVLRDGEEKAFLAKAEVGLVEGRKAIGIDLDDVGILQLPPHLALLQGAILAKETTVAVAQGLVGFFTQLVRGAADFSSVAGPIGIAAFGASTVGQGITATLILTALISINLALINLMPIPGLDGGRLLIIAIEAVLRRPIPERLTTSLTLAGFALLITLMLVVSYHDIARLVG